MTASKIFSKRCRKIEDTPTVLPDISCSKVVSECVGGCLSNIFQILFGAAAAGTGAGTDLTGLCCSCGRGCFPGEGEMHSQTQGDLSFGGKA